MNSARLLQAVAAALAISSAGCASLRHANDPWWGPDKARHFAVSMTLAAGASYGLAEGGADGEGAVAGGLAAAALAGSAKEMYDQRVKRTYFSGKDLLWDLMGGLAGGFLGAAAADE